MPGQGPRRLRVSCAILARPFHPIQSKNSKTSLLKPPLPFRVSKAKSAKLSCLPANEVRNRHDHVRLRHVGVTVAGVSRLITRSKPAA
jgi:hypothetical protein